MELGIEGKTAVVTGGTKGIGAAVTEKLRDEGARVVVVARGAESGPDSVSADVTDPRCVELITATLGADPPNILVNCAGTSFVRELMDLTEQEWRDLYELHVIAPMRLMRAYAPVMAGMGWGRIVNVSSSAGKRPSLTNPAYSVSKAAVLSLSRVFAEAYTDLNVLCNCVVPGPTETELWTAPGGMADQQAAVRGHDREVMLAAAAAQLPIGRMLKPAEVADVIVLLCSQLASGVAGVSWSVDGGHVQTIV